MIDLSVDQGASHISRYLGDGLVIATPTGSTGYTLALGGPIIDPTLEAFAISPIAPHSLSLRPLVVGSDQPIRVTAARVNAGTSVIVDGQISSVFRKDDTLEVRRSPHPALIVPRPGGTSSTRWPASSSGATARITRSSERTQKRFELVGCANWSLRRFAHASSYLGFSPKSSMTFCRSDQTAARFSGV